MTTLLVGLAGLLGVLARYGISRWAPDHESLLWATVAINVAGSFALGLLASGGWFSRDVRDVLGVGFLGGFTTFSTFSVQAVLEADGGRPERAALYVGASVIGGRRGRRGLRAGTGGALAAQIARGKSTAAG